MQKIIFKLFLFYLFSSSNAIFCQFKYYQTGFIKNFMVEIPQKYSSIFKKNVTYDKICYLSNATKYSLYLPIGPYQFNNFNNKITLALHLTTNLIKLSKYIDATKNMIDSKANIIFYVMSPQSTNKLLLQMYFNIEYYCYIILNDQKKKITHSLYDISTKNRIYPDKMNIDHFNFKIVINIIQGWNKISVESVNYNETFQILLSGKNIKYAPYIPFYTSIPQVCDYTPNFIRKYYSIYKMSINLNYTYGRKQAFNRLKTCLDQYFAMKYFKYKYDPPN